MKNIAPHVLLLSSLIALACHPIVPSDDCKQQMSACLAKCNPEQDAPGRDLTSLSGHTPSTMSTCEQMCLNCRTASSKAAPAPAPTPPGTPPPIPTNAVSPPPGIHPAPASDAEDAGTQSIN